MAASRTARKLMKIQESEVSSKTEHRRKFPLPEISPRTTTRLQEKDECVPSRVGVNHAGREICPLKIQKGIAKPPKALGSKKHSNARIENPFIGYSQMGPPGYSQMGPPVGC